MASTSGTSVSFLPDAGSVADSETTTTPAVLYSGVLRRFSGLVDDPRLAVGTRAHAMACAPVRAEWRRRLSEETGLVKDERLSYEYVRERLLTVPARRVLDRFQPSPTADDTTAAARVAEGDAA